MDLLNLSGISILVALTAVMFLAVPVERIKQLAVFGVIFGGLLPFAVIGTMQNLLGFWHYRAADPVTLAGIPVFLALAWLPAVIIFAHFMVQYSSPLLRLLLWLTIGAAVAWLQYLHIVNGMLVFRNWSLAGSFVLTLFLHGVLLAALHLMGHLRLQELID